jgi:outer membrane receptor for ferrienterochelin and colicin
MMSRRWTTLAVTALAFSMVAQAQSSQTSGAVRGTVTGKGGAPVAGAKVMVRNLETGYTRNLGTDANGVYQAALLPTGPYSINVSALGMKAVQDDKVTVSLGEASLHNFTLEAAEAGATVEIVGVSAVDVQQVNTVSTVDATLVQKVPLVSRNFLDLVRLTPGAVAGPGNPPRLMVEGGRQIMNELQIDGATNNSRFFGEQRGGAIIPFVFGADTIKELQVITNGYDTQYGNAAGAVVNAITKSGTNEFSGGLLYQIRNDSWQAKAHPVPYDPTGTTNTDKNLTRFGNSYNANFTVGGPIVKDKLFFFVGAETFKIDQQAKPAFSLTTSTGEGIAQFNAFKASSLYDVFTNPGATLGQEGGDLSTGAGGKTYQQETTNTSYFARLDYTFNERHRFALRVNYQKFKDTIGGGNTILNTAESNQLLNTTNAISWVLEANDLWTDNLISETRFQVSNERRPFAGEGVSPAIALGAFSAGTKTSTPRQMNEITDQLVHITTWNLGDWTLKGGFDLEKISIGNQFFNNGNGSIIFGDATHSPFQSAADWAGNTITGADRITYNAATSYNGGRVNIDSHLNSEFVQAQYQGLFSHRLTLTAGLRFNQQNFSKNPLPNANLAGLDSAPDSSTTDPRVAFSFDLDGKGKTVLRGGYGWFSTPSPLLLVANTMTGNGNTIVNYQFKSNVNPAFFTGPAGLLSAAMLINGQNFHKASDADLATLLASGGALAAGPTQVWDPQATMSRAKKASLGLEHDFGDGLTMGVKATYTTFDHLEYLENINLNQGNVAVPTPYNDGYADPNNNVFGTGGAGTPRPNTATVRGHVLNFGTFTNAFGQTLPGFGNVFLVKGDGYGRYRGLAFTMNKRFNEDFGFLANVTFSRSEDTNSNERSTYTSSGGILSELALGATSNPANPYKDFGPSNADRFMVMNFATYFPIWWGIKGSARFNYGTGLPYTALAANDLNGDGVRNDIAFGGRNGQRQPDQKTMDLRLSRAFKLYQKLEIEGSIDVFNLFNWTSPQVKDTEQVATTGAGTLNPGFGQIGDPDFRTREVQFGIRFRF